MFDHTSTWSDQGENNLGLNSENSLNSGATVSFDMYIPEDEADFNGVIKVQGIARLGDNWTWTENASIPEFTSANLIDTVEVDGKMYKKTTVSFTFGDEITADYLAEFTVKLAGWNCNYKGNIYYANVELKDGEVKQEDTNEVVADALYQWNFAEGIDGWYFDGVWDNKGENSIEWNEQYQALAMKVDYSNDIASTWSEIKASFWNDDFAVDGAILFRPFHENTGSWFWWGAAFCDAQTYKSVFKYTVEYLRDDKDVHNLLYVYGPGSEAANVEEYAERYPGDGYVDMVGFDMYHDNPTQEDSFIINFTKELNVVESFAKAHGKLVAVTETGVRHDVQEGDNQTALKKNGNARLDWHQEILDAVKASEASYYLVWANFSEKDGFYTPYVKTVKEDGVKHGQEMMDNFIRFFNQNNSIFAVNQKQALEQMKSVSIQAEAAVKQDGYVISPVAGTRVLEAVTLKAKVSGTTADDDVKFICKGAGEV